MEQLERLIIDMKESLEREIRSLEREVRSGFSQMNARFDNQTTRMDRHGALIQTGSRWTNRMNQWAEKIDKALDIKDREIADLRSRLDKLERPPSNGKGS